MPMPGLAERQAADAKAAVAAGQTAGQSAADNTSATVDATPPTIEELQSALSATQGLLTLSRNETKFWMDKFKRADAEVQRHQVENAQLRGRLSPAANSELP